MRNCCGSKNLDNCGLLVGIRIQLSFICLLLSGISTLKLVDNSWCLDQRVLEDHALKFFRSPYAPDVIERRLICQRVANLMRLSNPFSETEIKRAVDDMGAFKAPGLDGFQPLFY
ncbi:hypothetical protein V2J09_005828 [Rumex salicifolius]